MHQNENDNVISTIYFGERTKIGGHKSRETFRCCLRVYEVLTGLAKSNTLAGDNLWLQERKEIGSWSEKTPQHFLDCSTNWVVALCLKIYSKCLVLNFWTLTFSTNFCPIKTDLSGNTVWPQALGFQKLAKMDHFWHF